MAGENSLKILPIIMCGGCGTRVWPESRESLPKQFIPLLGTRSTFQMAVEMLADPLFETPIVISNQDYRFLVSEQLKEIGREARIVLEPLRRDSGPAVAVGAELAAEISPDTIVAILAADHVVKDHEGFVRILPASGRRRGPRLYRNSGNQAERAGDRLRLYQDRQRGRGKRHGSQSRSLRRKARCRDGRDLRGRGALVERRQFLLPRRCHARGIAPARTCHPGCSL